MPTVYPSHMYVLAPDHLLYLSLRPKSVDEVHVRFGAALAPEVVAALEDRETATRELVDFFDRVNAEDRFVVEGIYAGSPGDRASHFFTRRTDALHTPRASSGVGGLAIERAARSRGTRSETEETIMNRRVLAGVAVVLVAIMAAAAIGTTAYRAGVARGLADPGVPSPYYGYPGPHWGPFWHHGPFGFGFVGVLFPLLGFLLVFALLRGLIGGRRCAGPHGLWKAGVPPMFEEWHRRAHESRGH